MKIGITGIKITVGNNWSNNWKRGIVCYNCNKKGHFKRDCRVEGKNVYFVNCMQTSKARLLSQEIIINGKKQKAVFDTGASISVIRETMAEKLKLRILDTNPSRLKYGNGSTETVNQVEIGNVKFGSKNYEQQFVISKNIKMDILLGLDFFHKFRVNISFKEEETSIFHIDTFEKLPTKFKLESDITIPARTAKWINMITEEKYNGDVVIMPTNIRKYGVQAEPA